MAVCENVLESIGNTPMIRLNKMGAGLRSEVFVKVEGHHDFGKS